MCDGKCIATSQGLCRWGVGSDGGDAYVRGGTTMVPGEGSIGKSLHEQKPGESSAFAILLLYQALDAGWRPQSLVSCIALPVFCFASSGYDMFVSGTVESSGSWYACLDIFSRCFAL